MKINSKTLKYKVSDLRKMIQGCSMEDFQGKTNFQDLSYEERLDWLGQCTSFFQEFGDLHLHNETPHRDSVPKP